MGPSSLNNSLELKPHVLVADSDPKRRQELEALIVGNGFRVCVADSDESCRKAIAEQAPLVAIVDWALGRGSGVLDICQSLRATLLESNTRLILCIEADAEVDMQRATLLGVSDFLQHPVNPTLALVRIKAEIKRLETEQITGTPGSMNQQGVEHPLVIERTLTTEADLTEKISKSLVNVDGQTNSLGVLCIEVSDHVGNREWEELQPYVRAQLSRSMLGNITGAVEESIGEHVGAHAGHRIAVVNEHSFFVCMPDLKGVQEAARLALRILERLSCPTVIEGSSARMVPWIGIAMAPQDGTKASDLLSFARRAMSRAREKNSGGIEYYTEAMGRWSLERLMLEASLSQALEHEELRVFYQPRVDARTGRIKGMEALLRWMHPDIGMVSPAQFIPIAEESGLIVPIGEWVMHEACRQNQAWRDMGLPNIRVSVNLSSVQFAKASVFDLVTEALSASGLASDGLEVELTESILMEDPKQSIATLREIKQTGVHISIDDFGTGYSSLAYLKRFPIDALKIDRAFVDDVMNNADDAAIATAVILMGHSLKMEVVAEGVETQAQLDFLNVLQCDEVQGFFFSPPVPADKAELLLRGGDRRMVA